jgi:sterol desaturase/sphingolipid hydroxylase (fatty acid hydroxylase superfamily)
MESILSVFENMSSLNKVIWIFICLSISWVLEFGIPLKKESYNKLGHIGRNLIFLSTSMLVNILFGLATVGVFFWLEANQFGLLNWIELPIVVEILIAVMALDFFAQYISHTLLHKVAWMWKFHLVHHSDTVVDATTGTRHHPGDYLIRELFALVAIFVFGIPIGIYVLYRFLTIAFTYMTHANINLPEAVDKMISYVFISPNMHKFHHHHERPWTDTNFGNIFSIWDRLFGTFVYADVNQIKYGVDVLDDATSDNVGYQFGLPFNPNVKTDKNQ